MVEVRADFGVGRPTTINLAWVRPGCVLERVVTSSGARSVFRWTPSYADGGKQVVTFVATDGVVRATRSITVHVRSTSLSAFETGDVTGDGTDDLVVGAAHAGPNDTGAVYVWKGGGLDVAPVASLLVSGGPPNERLAGVPGGAAILLGDVTGDGQADVVVRAPSSDRGGQRRGAIYIWEGGRALVGQPAPWAVLTVPDPDVDRKLNSLGSAVVLLADMTGDGVLDVLAVTPRAQPESLFGRGAVHVWSGGAALATATGPLATLRPAEDEGILLGAVLVGFGTHVADLDADGDQDLVVAAPEAPRGGRDRGAVYVWRGRPDLQGSVDPDLVLQAPQPQDDDRLGDGEMTVLFKRDPIQIADVTGDGALDLVVCGTNLHGGGIRRSRILVWSGVGQLTGMPPASAVLGEPGDPDNTRFLLQLFADVTGDGYVDIVTTSSSVTDGRKLLVWAGGPSLVGSPAPIATLAAGPTSAMADGDGRTTQAIDLTNDGVLDIVVTCSAAVIGGVQTGAVRVWAGGPTLVGRPAELAVLSVPGASANDQLGTGSGEPVLFGDVTGDGQRDVLALASLADHGGTDRGALYIFEGGAALAGSLAPRATLFVPTAQNLDALGGGRTGEAVQLADLDLDGLLDVVVTSCRADRAVANAGAVFVWKGGAGLVGAVGPHTSLAHPGAIAGELLGEADQGAHLADVDGDGKLDLFTATPTVVTGTERGRIDFWRNVGELTGDAFPIGSFSGEFPFELLGQSFLRGGGTFAITDMTGDGVPDFRLLSPMLFINSRPDPGGRIYQWIGGPNFWLAPPARLQNPGAIPDDELGNTDG